MPRAESGRKVCGTCGEEKEGQLPALRPPLWWREMPGKMQTGAKVLFCRNLDVSLYVRDGHVVRASNESGPASLLRFARTCAERHGGGSR